MIASSKTSTSWISRKVLRRYFATLSKQWSPESDCQQGKIWLRTRYRLYKTILAMNPWFTPTKTWTSRHYSRAKLIILNWIAINSIQVNHHWTVLFLASRACHRSETSILKCRRDHWAAIILVKVLWGTVVLNAALKSMMYQDRTYPTARWAWFVNDVVMNRKTMKVLR